MQQLKTDTDVNPVSDTFIDVQTGRLIYKELIISSEYILGDVEEGIIWLKCRAYGWKNHTINKMSEEEKHKLLYFG